MRKISKKVNSPSFLYAKTQTFLNLQLFQQALYEASKRAKAGPGAKGAVSGPPERLDKRTLMQEAFTERMREQQVRLPPRLTCGAWLLSCFLPAGVPVSSGSKHASPSLLLWSY
jgi:hypothetical protein